MDIYCGHGCDAGRWLRCLGRRNLQVCLVAAGLSLAGTVHAASGKADRGSGERDHTVVPKTIYSTPKSDKIGASKAARLDRIPAGRDESIETDEEPDESGLPEISIPFDPHVRPQVQAQAAAIAPRTRPKLKIEGTPIDIAVRNGKLRLNRFHTLKVPMPHKDCRGFANIVVADYKLPKSAIDVLADNMVIVQKRICASNGSVVFTCYHREATVSLRRDKPDDGCS